MKLLYFNRVYEGIIVVYDNEKQVIDSSIDKFLNKLCLEELSTYKGRIDATKIKYGFKTLIPVYVSDECLLFPTMSPRSYDCVWVNFYQIKEIKKNQIIMKDSSKIYMKANLISRQLEKCEEIVFGK